MRPDLLGAQKTGPLNARAFSICRRQTRRVRKQCLLMNKRHSAEGFITNALYIWTRLHCFVPIHNVLVSLLLSIKYQQTSLMPPTKEKFHFFRANKGIAMCYCLPQGKARLVTMRCIAARPSHRGLPKGARFDASIGGGLGVKPPETKNKKGKKRKKTNQKKHPSVTFVTELTPYSVYLYYTISLPRSIHGRHNPFNSYRLFFSPLYRYITRYDWWGRLNSHGAYFSVSLWH